MQHVFILAWHIDGLYEQLNILGMLTIILFYNDCLDECSLR